MRAIDSECINTLYLVNIVLDTSKQVGSKECLTIWGQGRMRESSHFAQLMSSSASLGSCQTLEPLYKALSGTLLQAEIIQPSSEFH